MPNLSTSNVHIDVPLTNLALGYRPTGIIVDKIAPIITVDKQSNIYYVWGRENFKAPDTTRAEKSPAKRVEYSVSSNTYFCKDHALAHEIPIKTLRNADAALNLVQNTTLFLMDNFNQAWENRVASSVTSTTNVGSSVTMTTSTTLQWNDYINSDPINDLVTGINAIRSTTGLKPNTMIIGYDVWSIAMQHPQLLNAIYGDRGGGLVKLNDIGSLLGIDRIFLGDSIINTGTEGLSNTFSNVWGKNILLCYVANNVGLTNPSFMYTFRFPALDVAPMTVERRRDDDKKVEIIEVNVSQDEKIVSPELGYLMVGVVA